MIRERLHTLGGSIMITYSVDGTLTIPFNMLQKASGVVELFNKLLYENDIDSVTITTKSGDSFILNHYDDINVEYNQRNIEEIV